MRPLAAGLAALVLLPIGCAAPRPPPLALHLALQRQRIALLADASALEGSVALFARSRAGGALKGAGLGAASGVGMLGGGSCSGAICGAALVAALAVAVVAGTTFGAVAGALAATPEEEALRIERTLHAAVEELPAHLDLAGHVLAAAQREGSARLERVAAAPGGPAASALGALRAQGFASALEVGVRRIEFAGGSGSDPELALEVDAAARLVDTATGEAAYAREFRSVGVPRRFSAWVAADGEPMRRALAEALAALGEDVASAFFAQADLGLSGGTWTFPGTHGYGACWLVPVYPPNEYPFPSLELRWVGVPGARLALRWEPFPSERQRAKLERASGAPPGDVRYDLRIWEVVRDERGPLVYERRGLPAPQHALAQPLPAAHRYFWSVRACFRVGDGSACTPWASSLVPSRGGRTCESPEIPAWNYYRFVTR